MKKFLTIDFERYENVKCWKDIGAIPYALAKYYNYRSTLICLENNEKVDKIYEQYVNLIQLQYKENKIKNIFTIYTYVLKKVNYYDIINMYHGGFLAIMLACMIKLLNSDVKIYIKLDLGREYYNKLLEADRINNFKYKVICLLNKVIDLYTVETKKYVNELNTIKKFHGKVKYLPNGFFSDLVKFDKNIKKEKIILTVGRLGTVEKNTEMLVEAIAAIEPNKLKNWKIYLVGSMTDEFKEWFDRKLNSKTYLKKYFVVTGNINDKKKLYTIYNKSSVFVLPSRFESWGIALTEALAFSCYPIVTNCCDAFFEILDTNNFAKIIPNEDKSALKNSLEEILENKINYIKKGQIACEFIREKYDWQVITKNLNKYLE